MEKLKFKHLDGVFSNAMILWNSKNTWFCVFKIKSYIL